MVKDAFRPMKAAAFHYHDSAVSQMEACFAVGDRRLSDVLYRAWELGCLLDGWTEHFRYDAWKQAFEDCHLSIDFYAHRQRGLDEVLPWDHLDYGVTKKFLMRENELAHRATTTPNCRQACSGCGAACWKEGVCVENR